MRENNHSYLNSPHPSDWEIVFKYPRRGGTVRKIKFIINLVSLWSHCVRQKLSAERGRLHLKMSRISRKSSCTLQHMRIKRTKESRSYIVLSTRRYMTSLVSVKTCSPSNINPRQVRGVESSQLSVGSNAMQ